MSKAGPIIARNEAIQLKRFVDRIASLTVSYDVL